MNKILEYGLGLFCLLNASACFAVEKFEILPDLPDALTYAGQQANAATVAGGDAIVGAQSIGHEPSIISVVFSLLIVIVLIYLTGIAYAKLNKVGFQTLKKQQGDLAKSHVSVISTTQLGNNKTLHVVELDGKRMLIGASSGAIQLIKDLGCVSEGDTEGEYSHIEIPNIKIPKIEIPKIEIPSIGFSKLMTKIHKESENIEQGASGKDDSFDTKTEPEFKPEEISSEDVIGSLFNQAEEIKDEPVNEDAASKHIVDPDEYALYKKYLG